MDKPVLIDEFHVSILVPASLSKKAAAAVVRTLKSRSFRKRLHAAIKRVCSHFPSLRGTQIRVSR